MGDDSATNKYQFLTGYNYPSGGIYFWYGLYKCFGLRGMANPNITWYKATIADVGVDVDLWHGLLGIVMDFLST